MTNRFANHHHHSHFSFNDGYGSPEEHVARAVELGYESQTLTEHGNTFSHAQLEKAATKHGIKPIYGVELYTAPAAPKQQKWHLTVLAENDTGYGNLSRLVTASWNNFYYYPTTTAKMLAEHRDGLIVLSGCADSFLACEILGGKGVDLHAADFDAGLTAAGKFHDLLGDAYYLEVQCFPELKRARTLNPIYAEIGRTLGIPLVATCDVHYPQPGDNDIQKILHTVGRGKHTIADVESDWEYDVRLTLPETDRAVVQRLTGTGLTRKEAEAAIASSAEIAQRCTVSLPRAAPLTYPTQDHASSIDLIWHELRAGWRYRGFGRHREDDGARIEQVRYEMSIIESKGFVDYLLILGDAVRWAKDNGIAVGPARGSAAASNVCYLLRITEIDPMRYRSMMFERFIDPSRDDFPDIDLDFEGRRRDEVRHYLVAKYGEDRVGNVMNYKAFRGTSAVNDVARAHGIPPWEVSALKDRIIDRPEGDEGVNDTIRDTVAMFAEAAAVIEAHPEMDYARRLEGTLRAIDPHAAGLVVSSTPLSDVCATYTREIGQGSRKRTISAIAYDKRDAEYLGMLKLDFLGLTTMDMVADCLGAIGMTLEDLYAIDLEDTDTLAAFRDGDTIGIFQWDGTTTAAINRKVAPTEFMHLADINALSRPGPLFGGASEAYMKAKVRGEWRRYHPIVDQHTVDTYGQIVYQEQILAIVRDLGDFVPSEVGEIRRVIGKKKGTGAFNKLRQDFLEGADRHECAPEDAEAVWSIMVASAGYAFNVSHSVSYSALAFWCMWLKQHYPIEFYRAALRFTAKAGWPRLVRDAKRHDIVIKGIDIAESEATWEIFQRPDGHEYIRAGWQQVDGIGDALTDVILAHIAEHGPFGDWESMTAVKGIGDKTVERLRAAAKANDPAGTKAIFRELERHRIALRRAPNGTPPTHTSTTFPSDERDDIVFLGFVEKVELIDEVEAVHRRTGESAETILSELRDPDLRQSVRIICYDDGDDKVTVRINRWRYPLFAQDVAALKSGDLVLVTGDRKRGIYKTLHATRLMQLIHRAR